jgi:ribosomal protein S27E
MKEIKMANSNKNEHDDFYQVACVHCGENLFKFSRFTILNTESLIFHCPKCDKTTTIGIDAYGGLEIS